MNCDQIKRVHDHLQAQGLHLVKPVIVRSRFEGPPQPQDEYLVKLAEVVLNSSSSDEAKPGGRIGSGRPAQGLRICSTPTEFQLFDLPRQFERNSSGASTVLPHDLSNSQLSSPTSSISGQDNCQRLLLV